MENEQNIEPIRRHKKGSHIWGGLLLLAIGGLLLAKQTGAYIPEWVFTWQMLLIAIGIITGIKHQFRGGGWIILILIGGIFMYDRFQPDLKLYRYIWPLVLIGIGMVIILKPRRSHRWRHDKRRFKEKFERWREQNHGFVPGDTPHDYSKEDYLDVTSVFGGIKKIVVSKNFRGGDITNFMGGTEVNLSQADIQGTITLDTTNIFGGTKLIVPASWEVKSEATAIFGGIEDKRDLHAIKPDPAKVLIIDGTCIFGGIEIRNY
jgi:predicted membrane protein